MRELRPHSPGDPFRRIAWKASAKRGTLLVREMERQEQDVLWLVLDASVEGLVGELGAAPLDLAIEAVAAVAARALARGASVGLVVVASRLRSWVPCSPESKQAVKLAAALLSATQTTDEDRTDFTDMQIARSVLEHLRPLDPIGTAHLSLRKLHALVKRADIARARAPFPARAPHAANADGQALRRYMAAFGMEVPPALRLEREQTDLTLAMALERLSNEKPRPTAIYLWGPPPRRESAVARALGIVRRKRIDVRWALPQPKNILAPPSDALDAEHEHLPPMNSLEDVAERASAIGAHAAQRRGVEWLDAHGVRELRILRLPQAIDRP